MLTCAEALAFNDDPSHLLTECSIVDYYLEVQASASSEHYHWQSENNRETANTQDLLLRFQRHTAHLSDALRAAHPTVPLPSEMPAKEAEALRWQVQGDGVIQLHFHAVATTARVLLTDLYEHWRLFLSFRLWCFQWRRNLRHLAALQDTIVNHAFEEAISIPPNTPDGRLVQWVTMCDSTVDALEDFLEDEFSNSDQAEEYREMTIASWKLELVDRRNLRRRNWLQKTVQISR